MARIEVSGTALTVYVEGLDKLWALKSQLEIPLSHVVSAAIDPDLSISKFEWQLRAPGTSWPGLIKAGTYYGQGKRVFWDVHDPKKAVVIRLVEDKYNELVIEVDDPQDTVAAIQKAVAAR